MKGLFTSLAISSSLILVGCELSEEEKEQLEKAGENLEQLADQIIITYPAENSTIKNSIVTVRADVPEELNATKVSLFVDGIEIAYDDNGAPWEIEWPAYYWADDNNHSLLLKTTTESGSQVRNNESYQVEVSSEANDMLGFTGNLDGKQLQDTDELAISFNEVPYATRYEVKYGDKTNSETGIVTLLKNLQVGNYQLAYRALYDFSESTTLKGAWSESVAIEVLPPEIPVITGPVIGENEKGFTATFIWDSGNVEDKLTFKAVNNSSLQPVIVNVNADKGAAMIEGLDVGEFSWSVELENAYSHKNESEVKNFQINEIAAPIVYEPVKGYTETGHTLEFSWNAVADTDKYSVLVKGYPNENSFVEYESEDLSKLLVGELGFGRYEWKVQRTSISNRTIESDVIETIILEPAISNTFSKKVETSENVDYGITIESNNDGLDGSTYQIELSSQTGKKVVKNCTSICKFNELNPDEYSIRAIRINPVDQVSYINLDSIKVGLFTKTIGNTLEDSIAKLIKSNDGGFILLGQTSSTNRTPTLLGENDDWIVKLDSSGEQVSQYIENRMGQGRYLDFIQQVDGSILLVGYDGVEGVAVIQKLNKDLTPIWESEKKYKINEDSDAFMFSKIAHRNGKTILLAEEQEGETNSNSEKNYYLAEFNVETDEPEGFVEVPKISGSMIMNVKTLAIAEDGGVLVVGSGITDDELVAGYDVSTGVFLTKFDSAFNKISHWDDFGYWRIRNLKDSIFSHRGDMYVIGDDFTEHSLYSLGNNNRYRPSPVYKKYDLKPISNIIISSNSLYVSFEGLWGDDFSGLIRFDLDMNAVAEYKLDSSFNKIHDILLYNDNSIVFTKFVNNQNSLVVDKIPLF